MYKGNNPSAKRSQEWIAQSLISLMLKKSFEQITIKEIMENSELARQTFYQLFDSKEDVLEYYMDILFLDYLERCNFKIIDNLCEAAKLFFQFFNENTLFVESLKQNNKTCILQKKCQEYLQNDHFLKFIQTGVHNSEEKTFASAFVTAGLIGMLVYWFDTDKSMSTEELARLVCRITNTEE
ncbi:TetR/AcrR family transcriptional regulator [Clostridium sartagoforme]|jgi:AcrR family transcriptional regulator|uniref:TetR/AcrR family transcriptional regulator n=1 Tax=Clostridium sartagoforme TaxID=84031 RepID=UPI0031CDCDC5